MLKDRLQSAKKILIWGMGVEGKAARAWLQKHYPAAQIICGDDTPQDGTILSGNDLRAAMDGADIIVKAPSISLYRDDLPPRDKMTSLTNLWFSQTITGKTICITGSKGKSTTSSLIAHILAKLGQKVALIGNIGTPMTSVEPDQYDYYVIELSSYQIADFDGMCDIALVNNLYEDHLDWHKTIPNYFADKLGLLSHARHAFVGINVAENAQKFGISIPDNVALITEHKALSKNDFLRRDHNKMNVNAAITILTSLGFNVQDIVDATADYAPLPHRQNTLGTKNGVTYIDDSISTTAESTMQCLNVFKSRPITLIVGGKDRGIHYDTLARVISDTVSHVICMGSAGEKIRTCLGNHPSIATVQTMAEAVQKGKEITQKGGVIILSPAAPSHDLYKNYIEKSKDFIKLSGF